MLTCFKRKAWMLGQYGWIAGWLQCSFGFLLNGEYLLVDRINLLQFTSLLCRLVFLLGRCVGGTQPRFNLHVTCSATRYGLALVSCQAAARTLTSHNAFLHLHNINLPQLTRAQWTFSLIPVLSSHPRHSTPPSRAMKWNRCPLAMFVKI